MTLEENKTLVRRFVDEVLNARDFGRIGDFLASDYVDHGPDADGRPSLESLRAGFELWHESFPDHRITIEELVAEGDLVSSRSTCSATHRGEYLGVPATGKRITFGAHELYLIRDGKIAEHWEVWDEAAVLRQLGIVRAEE